MAAPDWICSKKKTYGYRERDEAKRVVYLEQVKNKKPEDLVYLDESGIDDNEVYPYAWGPKGPRILGKKYGWKADRLSIIAALNNGVIKAPFTFRGYCTKAVFEAYLEQVLVPELKPGQTVIMDNVSFHKGAKIEKLIQSAGCEILYLPAYSPDFNPIEHWWSPIKYHMRHFMEKVDRNLDHAASWAFQKILTQR